jgi:hypothetical protein
MQKHTAVIARPRTREEAKLFAALPAATSVGLLDDRRDST